MAATQPKTQLQPGGVVRWLDARTPQAGERLLALDQGEVLMLRVAGAEVCVRWRGVGMR